MPDDELLALHESLEELAKIDSAAADLVRLRFFAGLKTTEAAEALVVRFTNNVVVSRASGSGGGRRRELRRRPL
jgi:hypothetical protein